MAARRSKSQARRNQTNGVPGWAWLVAGLLLGIALILVAPRFLKSEGGDGFFRPKPNPDAQPAQPSADESVADEGEDKDEPSKGTQFDFYTLLPADEVAMSDAELAAASRAEAERNEDAADLADAPEPEPVDTTPPPSVDGDIAYILQAGAFGAANDAEAVKARIALLGLSARVESATVQGKTFYRVRMGPYGTASELAEAKRKLAGGGLPAMAIKAK